MFGCILVFLVLSSVCLSKECSAPDALTGLLLLVARTSKNAFTRIQDPCVQISRFMGGKVEYIFNVWMTNQGGDGDAVDRGIPMAVSLVLVCGRTRTRKSDNITSVLWKSNKGLLIGLH